MECTAPHVTWRLLYSQFGAHPANASGMGLLQVSCDRCNDAAFWQRIERLRRQLALSPCDEPLAVRADAGRRMS